MPFVLKINSTVILSIARYFSHGVFKTGLLSGVMQCVLRKPWLSWLGVLVARKEHKLPLTMRQTVYERIALAAISYLFV